MTLKSLIKTIEKSLFGTHYYKIGPILENESELILEDKVESIPGVKPVYHKIKKSPLNPYPPKSEISKENITEESTPDESTTEESTTEKPKKKQTIKKKKPKKKKPLKRKYRKKPRKFEHSREYLFDLGEVNDPAVVGGKGANLTEMVALGLPVPPGFTICTDARELIEEYGYHVLGRDVFDRISDLERKTGKKFGGMRKPLLVSVRSGAEDSMPGMLDSLLNVGLNSEMVQRIPQKDRAFFVECYEKLVRSFGKTVLGVKELDVKSEYYKDNFAWIEDPWERVQSELSFLRNKGKKFPQDVHKQLEMAIEAIFGSWDSEKAVNYRKLEGLSDAKGTAVNIQEMKFGNYDENSLAAVLFTRNPSTGEGDLVGSFIQKAQGDKVVEGGNSQPLSEMDSSLLDFFTGVGKTLERHFRDMQDIEVTVESGEPWCLQTRNAKRTSRARAKILLDYLKEGKIGKEEFLLRINPESLNRLCGKEIDPTYRYHLLGKGEPASPGIVSGYIVFSIGQIEAMKKSYFDRKNFILVGEKLETDDLGAIVSSQGILVKEGKGNSESHAVLLARGKDKVCVTGCDSLYYDSGYGWSIDDIHLGVGSKITLNGNTGEVIRGHVPIIESKSNPELEEILSLSEEYLKSPIAIRATSLNEIDGISPLRTILYAPSFSGHKDFVRGVLNEDEDSEKELEDVFFKGYSELFIKAGDRDKPILLEVYRQDHVGACLSNIDRLDFEEALLEPLIEEIEEAKKGSDLEAVSLQVGNVITYYGEPCKIIKECSTCGYKLEYVESGSTKCVSNEEMIGAGLKGRKDRLDRVNIRDLKIKFNRIKERLEKRKSFDVSKIYEIQLRAIDRAIKGYKKMHKGSSLEDNVKLVDLPIGSDSIVVDGTTYDVSNPREQYQFVLRKVQEVIKNG